MARAFLKCTRLSPISMPIGLSAPLQACCGRQPWAILQYSPLSCKISQDWQMKPGQGTPYLCGDSAVGYRRMLLAMV